MRFVRARLQRNNGREGGRVLTVPLGGGGRPHRMNQAHTRTMTTHPFIHTLSEELWRCLVEGGPSPATTAVPPHGHHLSTMQHRMVITSACPHTWAVGGGGWVFPAVISLETRSNVACHGARVQHKDEAGRPVRALHVRALGGREGAARARHEKQSCVASAVCVTRHEVHQLGHAAVRAHRVLAARPAAAARRRAELLDETGSSLRGLRHVHQVLELGRVHCAGRLQTEHETTWTHERAPSPLTNAAVLQECCQCSVALLQQQRRLLLTVAAHRRARRQ